MSDPLSSITNVENTVIPAPIRPGPQPRHEPEKGASHMATYTGFGRTNTFAVKDIPALQETVGAHFSVVPESNADGPGRVTLFDADDDTGDWEHYNWDDTESPIFAPDMIAEHLQDGQVAIFVHIGNEALRYLGGFSIAVHSDGRQIRMNLDDIYDRIGTEFGVSPESVTKASD